MRAKHLFDLRLAQGVEVVGNGKLPAHEAKAFRRYRLIERDDLDQWLACLGDDERLALRCLVNQARQMGLVYRITYDFDSKYLFETTGRYDGHYYFAPGKKWGFFPSVALGWRISEEDFLSEVNWIDNLKIRASYGEVGALAGSPFQYLSTYSTYGPAYAFGGSAGIGIRERSEANRNITWE